MAAARHWRRWGEVETSTCAAWPNPNLPAAAPTLLAPFTLARRARHPQKRKLPPHPPRAGATIQLQIPPPATAHLGLNSPGRSAALRTTSSHSPSLHRCKMISSSVLTPSPACASASVTAAPG
eukprot:scaffold24531_cov62-Isochrysis_galbana.AAC.2